MSKGDDQRMAGIRALLAIREVKPATTLALDVYQAGGLTNPVETYQRRFRSCFDPERGEYFHWWEVIAMMQVTGCHEPLFYLCDLLGYARPEKTDPKEQAAELKNKIAQLQAEMEQYQSALDALPVDNDRVTSLTRFSRSV
jgi:hypothetical protein